MALTKMQTLILWALIAKPGAGAFQKDIKPKITSAADRKALESAGLIEVSKRGASFWLEVNDRGWDWAAENLDAALPSRSTAGCDILQGWLARLKIFLQAKNLALAEVLAPPPGACLFARTHSRRLSRMLRGKSQSAGVSLRLARKAARCRSRRAR